MKVPPHYDPNPSPIARSSLRLLTATTRGAQRTNGLASRRHALRPQGRARQHVDALRQRRFRLSALDLSLHRRRRLCESLDFRLVAPRPLPRPPLNLGSLLPSNLASTLHLGEHHRVRRVASVQTVNRQPPKDNGAAKATATVLGPKFRRVPEGLVVNVPE